MIKRPNNSSINTLKKFSDSSIKRTKPINFWDQTSGFNNFFNIATITVGAGGATSIDFVSIPQWYTHLHLRSIARTNGTNPDNMWIQYNFDTGTNYSFHRNFTDASTSTGSGSSTVAYMNTFHATGSTAIANSFGFSLIDIFDYSNTNKFKTQKHIGGYDDNSTGIASQTSGNYRSTAAITSIKIYSSTSSTIAQNSSFALYGIKA